MLQRALLSHSKTLLLGKPLLTHQTEIPRLCINPISPEENIRRRPS